MPEGRTPLRQSLLALAVFLVAAFPFHYLCAEPYADLVVGGARLATALVGSPRVIVATPTGQVEVDRRGALEEFFRDLEQRPHPYGLLVLWSWIAVAPRRPWHRLLLAAGGTAVLVIVYALARACDAIAWFRVSLATLDPEAAAPGGGVIGMLGTLLSFAALVVVPGALALSAYPGSLLPREGGR